MYKQPCDSMSRMAAERRARVSASIGSSHIRRAIKFLRGTLQSGLSAFGSDLQHTITKVN